MRIKCWNLGFNAHGLKSFIVQYNQHHQWTILISRQQLRKDI